MAQTQPWSRDCSTFKHWAVGEILLAQPVGFLDNKLLYPMHERTFRQYKQRLKTRNQLSDTPLLATGLFIAPLNPVVQYCGSTFHKTRNQL